MKQNAMKGSSGFVAAALVGTLVSMLNTGDVPGAWNHLFQLPLLAGLPDLPQFAQDAFVQSLRFYSSGLWQGLYGLAPGEGAFTLLFVLAVLSRLCAFVGFLACAALIGVQSLGQRLVFVTLVAFSSLLVGGSYAGAGGLFTANFTHSEAANASMLLCVWAAAQSRFTLALSFAGVTFFLNAFMGVWCAVPVAALALVQLMRKEIAFRSLVLQAIPGLLIFGALASVVVKSVLANPEFGAPVDFDYPTYLTHYYAGHFLVASHPWSELAKFGLVSAVSLLAAWRLKQRDPRALFILVAICAFLLLWLAGALLPLVTRSPVFLNLHLLRAGVGVHLFGGLALAVLTTVWLSSASVSERLFGAPLLVLGGTSLRPLLALAGLALLLEPRLQAKDRLMSVLAKYRFRTLVLAVTVGLVWPAVVLRHVLVNRDLERQIAVWREIGLWARAVTPAEALFMIPVFNFVDPPPADFPLTALARGHEVFRFTAQRRVFVDFAAGAAVMWQPSYYRLWRERIGEVMALPDFESRIAYARAHAIDYLVDRCAGAQREVVKVEDRCVYKIAP